MFIFLQHTLVKQYAVVFGFVMACEDSNQKIDTQEVEFLDDADGDGFCP